MELIRSVVNALDRQTGNTVMDTPRKQDPHSRRGGSYSFLRTREASQQEPADRISDSEAEDRKGVESKTWSEQYHQVI